MLNRIMMRAIRGYLGRRGMSVCENTDLRFDDRYLDRREFRYILWINAVYQKIRNVPGHIVELGVARGRNSILFANFIEMHGEQYLRKYYGFDTFGGYTDEDLQRDTHLSRSHWADLSGDWVRERIKRAGYARTCTLVEGDLMQTLPDFLKQNPKFKAALVYVDCNAYRPSLFAMRTLKDYVAPGGIICIDELMQGGETEALIEFCRESGLEYRKDPEPSTVPAYTVIS